MEDRVNMVIDIRELGIKSIPVNFLNPIPGTPYENVPMLSQEEMRRIVAVFRCLIPDAAIRLAGGRGLLKDKGRACFQSGANAAISGDMLTTSGMTIEKDIVAEALKQKIAVYGLESYGKKQEYPSILLGFATLTNEEITEGISLLKAISYHSTVPSP